MKIYLSILFCLIGLRLHAQVNLNHPEKVFDLLLGTWQYGNNQEFETWRKEGNIYTAQIYSMVDGYKVSSQELIISKDNKHYMLQQKVVLQPNLPQIRYQLIEATSTKFVFENKKESFPQTITYEFADNTLKIIQGGKINGKQQSISFAYTQYNK